MSRKLELQQIRRHLRRQLGLCFHCTEPAMRGHSECEKHHTQGHKDKVRYRTKQQRQRGWKMVRVKL